jgi:hypothetical protein
MPQAGSVFGYDIVHCLTPALSYQLGVAALHHAPTSAARGYGYTGFTAFSGTVRAHVRFAGLQRPVWAVGLGAFLGGAAQLAQIQDTRLYFFYPSVLAGLHAALTFAAARSLRLALYVPFRYDLRSDMSVAAGAGLGVALQFPLLPVVPPQGAGIW